jgi:hypothetical protein
MNAAAKPQQAAASVAVADMRAVVLQQQAARVLSNWPGVAAANACQAVVRTWSAD